MVPPASFLAQYQALASQGLSSEEIEKFVLSSLINQRTAQLQAAAAQYTAALEKRREARTAEGELLLGEAEKAPDITDVARHTIKAHTDIVDKLEKQAEALQGILSDAEAEQKRVCAAKGELNKRYQEAQKQLKNTPGEVNWMPDARRDELGKRITHYIVEGGKALRQPPPTPAETRARVQAALSNPPPYIPPTPIKPGGSDA